MKYLFYTLFILFSIKTTAQVSLVIISKESLPERDTIKVMFLVCDTADIRLSGIPPIEKSVTIITKNDVVHWFIGYISRERHWSGEEIQFSKVADCDNCDGWYMKEINNLDQEKQKFDKRYVVWDKKEIQ